MKVLHLVQSFALQFQRRFVLDLYLLRKNKSQSHCHQESDLQDPLKLQVRSCHSCEPFQQVLSYDGSAHLLGGQVNDLEVPFANLSRAEVFRQEKQRNLS
jgi:hypothetical protein